MWLRKALYGLRQAPRAWNTKLDSTLKEMGFKQSEHEHAIYRRINGDANLLIEVYVDDLIITGSSKAAVESFQGRVEDEIPNERPWTVVILSRNRSPIA